MWERVKLKINKTSTQECTSSDILLNLSEIIEQTQSRETEEMNEYLGCMWGWGDPLTADGDSAHAGEGSALSWLGLVLALV